MAALPLASLALTVTGIGVPLFRVLIAKEKGSIAALSVNAEPVPVNFVPANLSRLLGWLNPLALVGGSHTKNKTIPSG